MLMGESIFTSCQVSQGYFVESNKAKNLSISSTIDSIACLNRLRVKPKASRVFLRFFYGYQLKPKALPSITKTIIIQAKLPIV
jgi:hypothetical protein